MATFETLPIESIEHVFHFIESPRDFLHLAQTCKTFYNIVNSTYPSRLHLVSMSCSPSETDSAIWQKLATSHHLPSLVKHLEICDHSRFQQFSFIRQLPIFRVDDPFVQRWTGTTSANQQPSNNLIARSNFEGFIQILDQFSGCQSVSLLGRFSTEEYNDFFAFIANNLSDGLRTLVVKSLTRFVLSNGYVPRNTLSRCSFNRLTTFYIDIDLYNDYLYPSLTAMLDSAVFDCSTLVNFTLKLTCLDNCLTYLTLMEEAKWPSLKVLNLGGRLLLFDLDYPGKETYIAFLSRHPLLESLRLEGLAYDTHTFQTQLPPDMLPHLKSLHSDFPVHSDILSRLHHLSNLQLFEPDTYSQAHSLRSCTIYTDPERPTVFEDAVKNLPQLDRLCVYFHNCTWYCAIGECACIVPYNPQHLAKLENLTHFGIMAKDTKQEVMDDLLKHMITNVPGLSYIYLFNDMPRQYQVIRNSVDGSYELKNTEEVFNPYCEDIFDKILKTI